MNILLFAGKEARLDFVLLRNNNQGDTEVFNAGERIASSELNAVDK